jgi:CRP/FNR family transcriptional regulator
MEYRRKPYADIEWARDLYFVQLRPFQKGDYLIQQGDPAFGLYYLHRGKVRLCRRTHQGRQQIFAFLKEGSLIGWEAFVRERYDYNALAITRGQALFIAREEFAHLTEKGLLQAMAQTLMALEKELSCTLRLPALQRLAKLLSIPENRELQRQELAALAGLSLEHTCRLLKAMEREGLLRLFTHRIEVLNIDHIHRIAGRRR